MFDLTTDILLALDAQLMVVYQSWFDVYGDLKPETEKALLSAIYTHFRLAYAVGLRDGMTLGRTGEIGPVLSHLETLSG